MHLAVETHCAQGCHTSLGPAVWRRNPDIIPDRSAKATWVFETRPLAACHTRKNKSNGGNLGNNSRYYISMGWGHREVLWDSQGFCLLGLACCVQQLLWIFTADLRVEPQIAGPHSGVLAVSPWVSKHHCDKGNTLFPGLSGSLDWVRGPDFDSCLGAWFIKWCANNHCYAVRGCASHR